MIIICISVVLIIRWNGVKDDTEFDCFAIAGDFNIHIDNAEIKTTK